MFVGVFACMALLDRLTIAREDFRALGLFFVVLFWFGLVFVCLLVCLVCLFSLS